MSRVYFPCVRECASVRVCVCTCVLHTLISIGRNIRVRVRAAGGVLFVVFLVVLKNLNGSVL